MDAFLGAIAALGLQLLLVVVYVGTLLTVKHLVVSRFFSRSEDADHDTRRPSGG